MNSLFYYIGNIFSVKNCNLRNFAAFLFVLFSIQYIPIESRAGVSFVKVGAMILCIFVFLINIKSLWLRSSWLLLYLLIVSISALLNIDNTRFSSLGYLALYIFMFVTFLSLIYVKQVFSFSFALSLIKGLLWAFIIVLLVQQAFRFVGIQQVPIINMTQILDRGIGANSLSFEPSSSARTMAVLFLAWIRMLEIQRGKRITISFLYQNDKKLLIGFLWSMMSMGSGTAFVALALLSLYFVYSKYSFMVIPFLVIIYFAIPYIDFEPLQRASSAAHVATSLDADAITQEDGSAAGRITPIVNTINNIDIFNIDTWTGYGNNFIPKDTSYNMRLKLAMVGNIPEYGFLSFIIMQIFIFSCVIRRIMSVETILWFFLFGLYFGNISYTWGVMMIFTTIRYFQTNCEDIKEVKSE